MQIKSTCGKNCPRLAMLFFYLHFFYAHSRGEISKSAAAVEILSA